MVFSASSKTITITPLLFNVLVDINLNIGDEFYNSGGTLNNRFFTVVNIIRNPELTIITVAENIVNETVSAGIFQYLNQFSLLNNATTIDFLNFIVSPATTEYQPFFVAASKTPFLKIISQRPKSMKEK
jgi:hypothetical protein